MLREEYINDDSKDHHKSESYDLTTNSKEKAGRKNLRTGLDFYHSRKYLSTAMDVKPLRLVLRAHGPVS